MKTRRRVVQKVRDEQYFERLRDGLGIACEALQVYFEVFNKRKYGCEIILHTGLGASQHSRGWGNNA